MTIDLNQNPDPSSSAVFVQRVRLERFDKGVILSVGGAIVIALVAGAWKLHEVSVDSRERMAVMETVVQNLSGRVQEVNGRVDKVDRRLRDVEMKSTK